MVSTARTGELAIRTDIQYGDSAKFAKELEDLGDIDELVLKINSAGGSVFEAMSMLYMLTTHPAHKVVIIEGLAASAASYLACGADEIRIFEPAMLMVHFGSCGCLGHKNDMTKTAELLDQIDHQIAGIYAARTGTRPVDWLSAMREETWFSSKELAAIGLAVIIPAKGKPAPATNRSTSNRTPRQAAIVNSLLASKPSRRPISGSVSTQLEALARRAAEVADTELACARNANREAIVRNATGRDQALKYLRWS